VLTASRASLFLDYFRVPYELDGATSPLPSLGERHPLRAGTWLRSSQGEPSRVLLSPPEASPDYLSATGIAIDSAHAFGRVVPDRTSAAWLRSLDGGWSPTGEISAPGGRRVASLWSDVHGNVFLPFDPDELIVNSWSEAYLTSGKGSLPRRVVRAALPVYYRLRPVLPRGLQIAARRAATRLQGRARFPHWPVETSLHDLYGFLFDRVRALVASPVPYLAPWPEGRSWAFVLTHDVETEAGCRLLGGLRDAEEELGLRSSWNFVPLRYDVEPGLLDALDRQGFEVGVHGLYHDGFDVSSLATLRERAPLIRDYAERWNASGFRSPATRRVWELMPLLGFDYDSSYPDTDPYEPQAGGCCTWLPFFNDDLVELPITLPQDHTLFVILGHEDESLWNEKADFLRRRGGMVLALTHPDYVHDGPLLACYERFLGRFADDSSGWHALPRDVAAWWRRRAESRPVLVNGGWHVEGPAAREARVAFHA
jgi:hypothetical protein